VIVASTVPVDADAQVAGGAVPARRRSLGSGFVIDPSGLIVTNRHVIEGANEITVNFTDGSSLSATLVAAAVISFFTVAAGAYEMLLARPLVGVRSDFGDRKSVV
jgi:S1-C subfamily serine protease